LVEVLSPFKLKLFPSSALPFIQWHQLQDKLLHL